MNQSIHHPTAIIDPKASLGVNVKIGPYCVVGPQVTLHDHVELKSHVVVEGITRVGAHTVIFPFASIGHISQDLKYKGEPSELHIGAHNVIREHVTMNPGTEGGGMVTQVGDHNLFMIASHVAHDCRIGHHVVMANNATLAGHVTVGDYAIIGGLSAVHQFVRIGSHAIIGGMSAIERDIIPYGMAKGERASLAGLNIVGLKRRGFSREVIELLRGVYHALFETQDNTTMEDNIQRLNKEYAHVPEVQDLLQFLMLDTSRPICRPLASGLSTSNG